MAAESNSAAGDNPKWRALLAAPLTIHADEAQGATFRTHWTTETEMKTMKINSLLCVSILALVLAHCGPASNHEPDEPMMGDAGIATDSNNTVVDNGPAPINCGNLATCAGRCADLMNDPANCGGCGVGCGANGVCLAGTCALGPRDAGTPTDTNVVDVPVVADSGPACAFTMCGNACVNTRGGDVNNCGGCGMRCNGVCLAGTCIAPAVCGDGVCNGSESCTSCSRDCGICPAVCTPTLNANCDGNAANGCEVNLQSDPTNCGACGNRCSAPNVTANYCLSGRCGITTCTPGYSDCDGLQANGCETRVNTSDNANCGACGLRCGAGTTCTGGVCQMNACSAGTANCDGVAANGCETRVNTNDNNNCGGCNVRCGVGQTCVSGVCGNVCGAGYTLCGTACVNLQNSNANCGACGRTCGAGTTCSNGTCGNACGVGQLFCNGACRNVATDNNYCGACGASCAPDWTCGSGSCHPPVTSCSASGQTYCGGVCVSTLTDSNNCGACNARCGTGFTCSGGACQIAMSTGFTAQLKSQFRYAGCTSGWIIETSSRSNWQIAGSVGYLSIADVTTSDYSGSHQTLRRVCYDDPSNPVYGTWGVSGTPNTDWFDYIIYRGRRVEGVSRVCLNTLHPRYPSWIEYVPEVPFNGAADNSCSP